MAIVFAVPPLPPYVTVRREIPKPHTHRRANTADVAPVPRNPSPARSRIPIPRPVNRSTNASPSLHGVLASGRGLKTNSSPSPRIHRRPVKPEFTVSQVPSSRSSRSPSPSTFVRSNGEQLAKSIPRPVQTQHRGQSSSSPNYRGVSPVRSNGVTPRQPPTTFVLKR